MTGHGPMPAGVRAAMTGHPTVLDSALVALVRDGFEVTLAPLSHSCFAVTLRRRTESGLVFSRSVGLRFDEPEHAAVLLAYTRRSVELATS